MSIPNANKQSWYPHGSTTPGRQHGPQLYSQHAPPPSQADWPDSSNQFAHVPQSDMWYGNSKQSTDSGPQSNNNWNWGGSHQQQQQPQQQHEQHLPQQQQQQHLPQQQQQQQSVQFSHTYFQGYNNQNKANQSDPWDWGLDENNTTTRTEPQRVYTPSSSTQHDATWDWSVEGTSTSYEVAHMGANVGSDYVRGKSSPNSGSKLTSQNLFGAFGTFSHENSRSSVSPSKQDSNSTYKTTDVLFSGVNSNYDTGAEHSQTDSSNQNIKVDRNKNSALYENSGYEEQVQINNQNYQNVPKRSQEGGVDEQRVVNESFPHPVGFGAPKVHEDYVYQQDQTNNSNAVFADSVSFEHQFGQISDKLTSEGKNASVEGLPSQWSTESLPSQGSDEAFRAFNDGAAMSDVATPSSETQSLDAASQIAVGDADVSQQDHYSSVAVGARKNSHSTSSVDNTLLSEHAAQQCSENRTENTYESSDYSQLHETQYKSEPATEPAGVSDVQPLVNSVSNSLEALSISGDAKCGSVDVENEEIVSPEAREARGGWSNFLSNTPVSNSPNVTPPPPMFFQGPPPASTPPSMGGTGNPYAATKSNLTHKHASKYREGSARGFSASPQFSSKSDLNTNVTPPLQPENVASPSLPSFVGHAKSMESFNARLKTQQPLLPASNDVNLETVPDNKERPDQVEQLKHPVPSVSPYLSSQQSVDFSPQQMPASRLPGAPVGQDPAKNSALRWNQHTAYSASPENMEVAPRCGPDRNQYLETGQLTEEEHLPTDNFSQQFHSRGSGASEMASPDFQRMVPGQMNDQDSASSAVSPANLLLNTTPPPGLHRMIPGQFTEREAPMSQQQAGEDELLHRMVPGQPGRGEEGNTIGSISAAARGRTRVDDILPPGLRRMVPGESSSPESQSNGLGMGSSSITFQPIDAVPREPRVVTGVAQDEMDAPRGPNADRQLSPSPIQVPSGRLKLEPHVKSQPPSPVPETPSAASSSLPQPPSERSETIGSDSVEMYQPANTEPQRDAGGRASKDRERRHRDDQEGQDAAQTRRRDYYGSRDHPRDRDDSPGSVGRERDRVGEDSPPSGDGRSPPSGSGRYRDERDRRRPRAHEDSRRVRSKRSYNRVDDEGDDTEDYSSDRDRSRRDKPLHKDDYDHRYRGRIDKDRDRRDRGYHRSHEKQSSRDRYDRGGDRDRDRDRRRHDQPPDYYPRGYEEDPYYRENQRSRPSSRSGSKVDYDDYHHSREYHGYAGYGYYGRPVQPYQYDPYYNYSKYYENLRRTNPAAYAEMYAKYYGAQPGYHQGSFSEDRASVHSGRSSANEDLQRERNLDQTATSVYEEPAPSTPQRLTPAKFPTAHVRGTFTARGQLVKVLPHYPLDGQPAVVEIHNVGRLLASDEWRQELEDFPGPLVKGTHKNSLINFCVKKIKKAERDLELYDRDSVILLWRLLILLLKQNGTVVGEDIAELLLSNTDHHGSSMTISSARQSVPSPAVSQHSVQEEAPHKSEEDVTNEFRQSLLYGNTKEALETAMKHGLWGHALFLASKMDQRTYANVMMRFANGLTMNDPLQTLYQLMSGRQPAAVTCCADEKWGDWRPHLAMIISNSSEKPDLFKKAITTLGDTLGARGCLHAAHFCYLMVQQELGTYTQKSSKIVLIGSSHSKRFNEFASNEAIQMTELYIYACQLADPEMDVPQFQSYKLLYAQRLAELGMSAEAIHYVEVIATSILKYPHRYTLNFLKMVYDLGECLKFHDPVFTSVDDDNLQLSDPQWLLQLRSVIDDYQAGVLQTDAPNNGSMSNLSYSEVDASQPTVLTSQQENLHPQFQETFPSEAWSQQNSNYLNQQQHQQQQQWNQQEFVQQPRVDELHEGYSTQQESSQFYPGGVEQNSGSYWWPNESQVEQDQSQEFETDGAGYSLQQQTTYQEWSLAQKQVSSVQEEKVVQQPPSVQLSASSPEKPKPKKEKSSKPTSGSSSGWFGGLWNKIALRPKNQMKLPDDKNPSIVWDPDNKRWTNLDNDEEESGGPPPPPPKASELAPAASSMEGQRQLGDGPAATPSGPPGANMYKLNKGRSLRASYVDVLANNKVSKPVVPATELFPSMGPAAANVNYFVPAPVDSNDDTPTDFLSPSSGVGESQESTSEQSQNISRWSSTSSLSREVQFYTSRSRATQQSQSAALPEMRGDHPQSYGMPLMFDPTSLQQQQQQPSGGGKGTGTLGRKRYHN